MISRESKELSSRSQITKEAATGREELQPRALLTKRELRAAYPFPGFVFLPFPALLVLEQLDAGQGEVKAERVLTVGAGPVQ